ncbi:unnamed protein product, partial [Pylaiella littoralis]
MPLLANPSTAESATWRDLGSHHKEDFIGRTRGHSPPTSPLPAGRDNGQCGDPGEGWCPSASSTHASGAYSIHADRQRQTARSEQDP